MVLASECGVLQTRRHFSVRSLTLRLKLMGADRDACDVEPGWRDSASGICSENPPCRQGSVLLRSNEVSFLSLAGKSLTPSSSSSLQSLFSVGSVLQLHAYFISEA